MKHAGLASLPQNDEAITLRQNVLRGRLAYWIPNLHFAGVKPRCQGKVGVVQSIDRRIDCRLAGLREQNKLVSEPSNCA
ncbi:hypothetical protein PV326_010104, partial [Microctonus aethiopoides]